MFKNYNEHTSTSDTIKNWANVCLKVVVSLVLWHCLVWEMLISVCWFPLIAISSIVIRISTNVAYLSRVRCFCNMSLAAWFFDLPCVIFDKGAVVVSEHCNTLCYNWIDLLLNYWDNLFLQKLLGYYICSFLSAIRQNRLLLFQFVLLLWGLLMFPLNFQKALY